jgi:hypothetical protein
MKGIEMRKLLTTALFVLTAFAASPTLAQYGGGYGYGPGYGYGYGPGYGYGGGYGYGYDAGPAIAGGIIGGIVGGAIAGSQEQAPYPRYRGRGRCPRGYYLASDYRCYPRY